MGSNSTTEAYGYAGSITVTVTDKAMAEGAEEFEKVIERLKYRRTDTFLHSCNQLAVDTAEEHARQEAENKAREDQNIC